MLERSDESHLSVTWIGHSTFLIQLDGVNVLTDPIWSARASPVAWLGPKRWVPPAMSTAELPAIDVVLISHDHYDHLDRRSAHDLATRHPTATWCVPLGVATLVSRWGVKRVVELDWWATTRLLQLAITCTPAQHFSGRSPRDRGRRLWCSWCIRGPLHAVHFGGDSGLHPEFAAIGAACGPFDTVLLPIGAYAPRWFMRPVHMDPEEAIDAYVALIAKQSAPCVFIPMHWGTFKLADDPMGEPPARLREAWKERALPVDRLSVLAHGESRRF